MKKFAIFMAIISLISSSIQAQNYTLQANNISNNYTPQNNSSSFASSFCSGMSDVLFPTSTGKATKSTDSWYNSFAKLTSSSVALSAISSSSVDPYLISINGNRYMLIKDNNDGILDKKDILGIYDTKKNIFASLKPLDLNQDNKLTGEELTKAGIRLVKINNNGKLLYNDKSQDFNNSDIVFIHLTEIRKAYKNNGNTGDFGYYDVVINLNGTKQLVTGIVTFEKESDIQKYFG